ncbi:MAG: CsgG/HfaB family protein [Clostridiales bacterium]|nr:CsgG/HfaB family protein [Clostridiales bacterium]
MKKKFLFIALLAVMGAALFCQSTDSRKGYFKLAWGSSVDDAKNAGYKLTKDTGGGLDAMWSDSVDLYRVVSNEKIVKSLAFAYYKGKLFWVFESVQMQNVQAKLESRYGNFKKKGINKDGGAYADWVMNANQKIDSFSILITPKSNGIVEVTMQDWNVYKRLNKAVQKFVEGGNDLVSAFETLAKKLVDTGADKVSTYAIIKLSSDFNNAQYDEYITDILTEAIFNTGSVKIIERGNLEKIIKEQKLQASGLIDERTAKAVGKISGADYVCYGSVKDIGQKFTVSARVVDVETGEICAMSRDTIEKDEYLLGSSGGASGSRAFASPSRSSGKPVKTAWTVTKNRNDFDGCTVYTFKCPCSDGASLFFGYEKRDNPRESRAWAGQDFFARDLDIKLDSGAPIHKKYISNRNNDWGQWWWYLKTGTIRVSRDAEKIEIFKGGLSDSKDLYMYFKNNDSITIRSANDGKVRNFQTAGFMALLEENGITDKEIMSAFANEF